MVDNFRIGFINEALAMNRNIASPLAIRFKISPDGFVQGANFNGMEFTRHSGPAAGSRLYRSPDNLLSFELPAVAAVKWAKNGNGFAASYVHTSIICTISPDPSTLPAITGPSSPANSFEPAGMKQTGAEMFGNYIWTEKSFRAIIA